jgi:alpha-amylase
VYLPEDTAGVLENDIVRYGRDVPADLGSHLPAPIEEEQREADRIRRDAERYSSSQASR